ncbi:copper resistance protein CopC [Natrinema versiforme]|uniref:Copper resistance protein CopC n=1 Tax=Natrinema versiforme TaxID=88724 RepID=A0A4P8WEU4_9EURY|nr:copper resistance protein CopC [Natrinema versiforme]QCS41808.1 copper resistance protein CopC [Natrinema versiforme]
MATTGSVERTRSHHARARRVRLLVGLVVVALALSSLAAPVAAHAYLSNSDPSNGDRVGSVPDEVTLTFGGDGVQTADVTVIGPDGEDVSGDAAVDADDSRIVRVPIADAAGGDGADGLYTVRWAILADDGHETDGSFVFSVGDGPLDRDAVLAAAEGDGDGGEGSIPLVETAAKGLLLVALIALVGGPVTAAVAVYPVVSRFGSPARTVDRRLTRLFAAAGGLLLVSVLGLGLSRAASVGPPSLETLVEFAGLPLGTAWVVQLVLAAILVVVLALAVAGSLPRRVWLPGTVAGAVSVGATVGWTSHSAAAIDRLQGTAVDFAHVGAAGLWVGGLVVLAVAVPPALREAAPDDRAALAAGTIRRYSLLALGGVALAAATGLLLAAWHVPTLESIGASRYGVTLSAKSLLVLLALGLGGFTRFVLLQRLESAADGDRADASGTIAAFTRAVRLEVAVLVLVVLLSGVLTSVPTAAVGGADDGLERATIERQGDVDLELTAIPATHGGEADDRLLVRAGEPVVFEVAFRDGDEPLESERPVRLLADGPDEERFEVDLKATDDRTYATVRALPASGDWRLRITGGPDGRYVDEWIDVHALADATERGHNGNGESREYDRGTSDAGTDSSFTAGLRIAAVAVGVVGTAAVTIEAVRTRRR